ncbi:MAG: MFS transporter [Puniceicoccales bacterium]|jgi:MFS family permease|nr:MFS transporter [Puniceicoccales bacterium]
MAFSRLSLAGRTCLFDSLRLFFAGAVDSVFISVSLLIAIRLFHASVGAKTLLSSMLWFGGLTAPALIRAAASCRCSASRLCAALFAMTALFLAGAAYATSVYQFILAIALAGVCYRADGAAMARIYAENYGHGRMASRMALGLVLSALMAIAFGQCSGAAMDRSIGNSRAIILISALCSLFGAAAAMAIPSGPIRSGEEVRSGSFLKYFVRNPLLAKMSIYFTAVGLAYQMLIPMRIEHLTNRCHGWNLSNFRILLLSLVVPNAARLLSTPLVAILFDRLRLIAVRILTNVIFLFGIAFYFDGQSFAALLVGGSLLGVAMAGSFVMHNLWLAKIVPPKDLPQCMAIYLLMTGLRSICAPFCSYALLSMGSTVTAAHGAAILVIASTVGFWFLRREPAIR